MPLDNGQFTINNYYNWCAFKSLKSYHEFYLQRITMVYWCQMASIKYHTTNTHTLSIIYLYCDLSSIINCQAIDPTHQIFILFIYPSSKLPVLKIFNSWSLNLYDALLYKYFYRAYINGSWVNRKKINIIQLKKKERIIVNK